MIEVINTKRLYQPSKPIRDPLYKRFVKRLPCQNCGKTWNIDPCHTGPHGASQKSSDLSCIPLCRRCHDLFDADPRGFTQKNRMDVPALIAKLNQFYCEKLKGQVA